MGCHKEGGEGSWQVLDRLASSDSSEVKGDF